MRQGKVGRYKVRRRLPTTYYTEIGRIVVRFATLEMKLFHITLIVLGVGRKPGRLAIRQRRAGEQITLIRDLANLYGLNLSVKWNVLEKALKEAESYRDRVSHSVWLHHTDTKTPVLQDFSTRYIPNLEKGHNARINPLAVKVPIEKLREIRRNMDHIDRLLDKIENLILKQKFG